MTEKAIKNHCKRLHKEITVYNKEFTLGKAQNLFAKTLGFKNFHELKIIFNNRKSAIINTIDDFYNFIGDIECKSDYIWFLPDGTVKYQPHNGKTQNISFVGTQTYGFNNHDFKNIINLILSNNDYLLHIQRLNKKEEYLIKMHSECNEKLHRDLTLQIYKQRNEFTSIKILINYKIKEEVPIQFHKKYKAIQHLF